jgi:integrase
MDTKSRKAPKRSRSGTVQIRVSNSRLQLVFTYGEKRHFVSLGVSDKPFNRRMAQEKVFELQRDIEYGQFDSTHAKYKLQSSLTTAEPEPPASALTLTGLWTKYMEYKVPNASPKTIDGTYEPVLAHLNRCKIDGLAEPLKFRMGLLRVTTQSQAKRSLMQLSAACKWGMKHGLVVTNPFEGMYKELEATKPDPPMAFSVEERDRIISAFENDSRSGIDYRHYAAFVKFLFWSGCRPCEAIGLRWGSVMADCSKIHFHESIVEVSGKQVRRKETKTGVERWFTCPTRLQALLRSLRPGKPNPDSLVFVSPKGGAIGESNFASRGWKKVLTDLGLESKDGIKMTPYNCRDTFITLQAVQGNSSTMIARWVGNSSKVIEEKYLDRLKLENLRPTDV